jgi:hypothetical protein
MRIDSNGNVGIGTSTPVTLLHLQKNSLLGIRLERTGASPSICNVSNEGSLLVLSGNASGVAIFTGATPTEKMRVDTTGNVGIGTIAPDVGLHYTGDTPKLRIESTNSLDDTLGTEEIGRIEWEAARGTNRNVPASIRVQQAGTWSAATPWLSPTSMGFYTQDNTGVEVTSPRLFIGPTGNVGIGTTTAATLLDVAGDVSIADKIIHTGDTNTAIRFPAANTVAIETAGSERMRIDSAGRLGLGVSNPSTRIQVAAQSSSTGVSIAATEVDYLSGFRSSQLVYNPVDTTGTTFEVLNSNLGVLSFLNTTNALIGTNGNTPLIFATLSTERMRITATGNVGIGTTTAATKLDVNGEVTAVDFNTTSDISVKENIYKIDDALNKVQQLNGVTFNFINDDTKTRHAGVIAQDVEKVLPEAVKELDGGIKHVAYGNLIGLLVEAIKEQQKQIEQLHLLVNK